MHLNPISAAFPSLAQHDRTAQVKVEEDKFVEVGTVLCIDKATGFFKIAEDATDSTKTTKPLYMALQRQTDMQARMAGLYRGTSAKNRVNDALGAGAPRDMIPRKDLVNFAPGAAITGIALDGGEVWETDMFDATQVNYAEGVPLTVKNGRWTTDGATEANALAHVRGSGVYSRWINNKGVDGAEDIMTGDRADVIQVEIA